jgi:hypothetical protein
MSRGLRHVAKRHHVAAKVQNDATKRQWPFLLESVHFNINNGPMYISQYNILFLKTKSHKLRRENGSLLRSGVDKTPFWKAACVITLSSWKYSFQHESQTYICISQCNSILLKTKPFHLRREKGSCSGVVLIRHPFAKQYPITKPPLNIQTAVSGHQISKKNRQASSCSAISCHLHLNHELCSSYGQAVGGEGPVVNPQATVERKKERTKEHLGVLYVPALVRYSVPVKQNTFLYPFLSVGGVFVQTATTEWLEAATYCRALLCSSADPLVNCT